MPTLAQRTLPAGAKIRILVVDDSLTVRRIVSKSLEEDPQLEVVGYASNGELALRRVEELRPDVITLDVDMPVMDGLETLRQLKAFACKPVIIMLSATTGPGAVVTIHALSLGADDYVSKPVSSGASDEAAGRLRSDLAPKIKQFFFLPAASAIPAGRRLPIAAHSPSTSSSGPRPFAAVRKVVAIGVSTGGPNALAVIIPMFPADFHLPVLIVQHMPSTFTKLLAERLNTLTPLHVQEAADGNPVIAGNIYLAAGGSHMGVCKIAGGGVSIALNQDPPEHSCRPAVDVLFRSVAEVYGGAAIAVVLTGMGCDGSLGAQALHAQGAYIIAQDEASSVVWGMPASVVQAGVADAVVDLHRVVSEIVRNA